MVLIIHPGTQWSRTFAENSQGKKKHEKPLGLCTFSRVFTASCLKLCRTFHVFGTGDRNSRQRPLDDITVGNVAYMVYANCPPVRTFGK